RPIRSSRLQPETMSVDVSLSQLTWPESTSAVVPSTRWGWQAAWQGAYGFVDLLAAAVQLRLRILPKPASAGSSLRRIVRSGAQEYDTTKSLPHLGAGSPSVCTSIL